jgi:hypothetical protein
MMRDTFPLTVEDVKVPLLSSVLRAMTIRESAVSAAFLVMATLSVPCHASPNENDITFCSWKGGVAGYAQQEKLAGNDLSEVLKVVAGPSFPKDLLPELSIEITKEIYGRKGGDSAQVVADGYYDECLASYFK